MSRKIKFTVSIKELAFSYEGDSDTGEEVQRGIQRSLGGILGMQSRAMGLEDRSQQDVPVIETVASAPAKPKKRRKVAASTNGDGETNGSAAKLKGVPGLLQKLIDEGFMGEERTVEAVREELSNHGRVLQRAHVSTRLKHFVAEERLLRKKNSDGILVYWAKTAS